MLIAGSWVSYFDFFCCYWELGNFTPQQEKVGDLAPLAEDVIKLHLDNLEFPECVSPATSTSTRSARFLMVACFFMGCFAVFKKVAGGVKFYSNVLRIESGHPKQ
jgi:hypothetical protein